MTRRLLLSTILLICSLSAKPVGLILEIDGVLFDPSIQNILKLSPIPGIAQLVEKQTSTYITELFSTLHKIKKYPRLINESYYANHKQPTPGLLQVYLLGRISSEKATRIASKQIEKNNGGLFDSLKRTLLLFAIQTMFDPAKEIAAVGMIDEMKKLLIELKRTNPGFKLIAFSNKNNASTHLIWERFKFDQLFDLFLTSEGMGALKPSEESFDALCSALQDDPHNYVYLDIPQVCVKAAASRGFIAFAYENAHNFRERLRELGVSI